MSYVWCMSYIYFGNCVRVVRSVRFVSFVRYVVFITIDYFIAFLVRVNESGKSVTERTPYSVVLIYEYPYGSPKLSRYAL